jgi:hypothetical protein
MRGRSLSAIATFIAFAAIAIVTTTTITPLAYARTAHTFESVITEVPAEGPGGESVPAPGGLSQVNSMTTHSGDLFVYERIEGEGAAPARMDQWAPSLSKPGEYEFVSQLPLAVPELGSGPDGVAFGSAGSEPEMYLAQSPFTAATGVHVFAAGSCGTLACATFQHFWTGAEVPENENGPFAGVSGVVVDHSSSAGDWASGDVFVADGAHGVVDIFEAETGGKEHYVTQVPEASGPIAVSGFNGDLIVGNRVFRPEEEAAKKGKYAFACQLELSGAPLEGIGAVAVDDSTAGSFAGEIYVSANGAVDEFGPSCEFRGDITSVPKEGAPRGLPGQTEEVPLAAGSLAVDSGSHRVFVAQQSGVGVVDVFGPDEVLPDVVTEAPSNLALETEPATGATSWGIQARGSVNPVEVEGGASCSFPWGLTEAFGQQAPCSAPVPAGPSPVSVHGSLTGLEPDTSYVYRLQATNTNGTNHGQASQDYRFTTPGPGLHSESASEVSSSSATLEASIAPHDAPTEEHDLQAPASAPSSYFFQYSTKSTSVCAAEPGGCTSVPLSPASAGSGPGDAQVSQHLAGLTPNTTYHYRLVAENEALPASNPGKLIAFYAPDRTFTTQGPGGPVVLPDGRAWELVSPADKLGAKIYPDNQDWSSLEGSRLAFLTNTPTEPEPPGAGNNRGVQVLASRLAPGQWSSVDINLSRSPPGGVTLIPVDHPYNYFSPDLGLAVAESLGPFSIPEGTFQNERGEWERIVESSPVPIHRTPYLRHNSTCSASPATCYEPLLDSEDVTSGENFEGAGFNGGGTYFAGATPDARHVLIGSNVRLTSTPTSTAPLYEWSADKPPAERLSQVSLLPVSEGGEPTGGLVAGLSTDGSRVLFVSGGLYLRDVTRSETVRLDLTEGGSAPSEGIGPEGIGYAGGTSTDQTSTDLSKVFFIDGAMLTSRSGAEGGDLYVCELGPVGPTTPKCALTDLTPARPTGHRSLTEPAQVSRVLNVSHDGSYVYFLAKGVQAAGATPAEGDRENLYVAHEQEGKWVTSFIASAHVIVPAFESDTETAASPDGRWLAFSSPTSLTGYDNRDAKTGTPDTEVYLYGAGSGSHPPTLVCASCNPAGARPLGPAIVPRTSRGSGGLLVLGRAHWQQEPGSRSLSDSGRLFFDSGDALVPQDTNGSTDVYEFEPASVGTCTAGDPTFNPVSGGCAGLISSGRAAGESLFMEASATGSDVFFTTAEPLVAKDKDTALDVYDAHECTAASPCPASSILPPPCTTEASCIAPPSPQPSIFGPPSSATFAGQGNILPEPKPKTAAQIRAEKLSKALASCRHRYKRQRKRRAACEKQAHKAYGSAKRAKRAGKSAHANRRAK